MGHPRALSFAAGFNAQFEGTQLDSCTCFSLELGEVLIRWEYMIRPYAGVHPQEDTRFYDTKPKCHKSPLPKDWWTSEATLLTSDTCSIQTLWFVLHVEWNIHSGSTGEYSIVGKYWFSEAHGAPKH